MKRGEKYYVGSGYFHESKWVNKNGKRCFIPNINDHIYLDNKAGDVIFGFKNKRARLWYNLIMLLYTFDKNKWNKIHFKELTINFSGNLTIKESITITGNMTWGSGTLTYTKKLNRTNNRKDKINKIFNINMMIEEFEYKGFMSSEAQKFFEGNIIREERDGCATVGSFIKLADGKTHLPSKGDKFIKEDDGRIILNNGEK